MVHLADPARTRNQDGELRHHIIRIGADKSGNHCLVPSHPCISKLTSTALADLGGARAGRAPPYGSRFFRFDMQNF